MSRGIGLTELLTELPTVVVVCFAVVTQLGDFWFTFTVCALAYWLGPYLPGVGEGLTRDRAAIVVALLVSAITLAVSLKLVFALPRPVGAGSAPEASFAPAVARELYVSMATGDGYGFPSGHATTAVLVWGGFGWAIQRGSRRQRAGVAATVVCAILISRLVLGVHYVVDVVVGAAVAGGFLWLALTRLRTPERVLGVATAVALVGLVAGGLSKDVGAVVGMSVAGTAAWTLLPTAPTPTRRGAFATAGLGMATVGIMAALALWALSSPLTVTLFAAAGTVLLVAMPLAGERVAKKA